MCLSSGSHCLLCLSLYTGWYIVNKNVIGNWAQILVQIKKYNSTEDSQIQCVLGSVKPRAAWGAGSLYCSTCRWCCWLFLSCCKDIFLCKMHVPLKRVKRYFSEYFNIHILETFNTTTFSSQLPDCTGKLMCESEFSSSLVGCRLLSAPSSLENKNCLEKIRTEKLKNKIYF